MYPHISRICLGILLCFSVHGYSYAQNSLPRYSPDEPPLPLLTKGDDAQRLFEQLQATSGTQVRTTHWVFINALAGSWFQWQETEPEQRLDLRGLTRAQVEELITAEVYCRRITYSNPLRLAPATYACFTLIEKR